MKRGASEALVSADFMQVSMSQKIQLLFSQRSLNFYNLFPSIDLTYNYFNIDGNILFLNMIEINRRLLRIE
jgi:hypothetical protein